MNKPSGTESFLAFSEHREVIMIKEERPRELSKQGAWFFFLLLAVVALVPLYYIFPGGYGRGGSSPGALIAVLLALVFHRPIWRVLSLLLKGLGKERKDWTPVWVDCRLMVPTVLEFDHDSAVPMLRWSWDREHARVLESATVASPITPQTPSEHGLRAGRFELEEGKTAFDLYRNPRTEAVLLEVRRTDTGQRLVLQLDDAWIEEDARQALPELDLSGPTLDRHDASAFLTALVQRADIQGLRLPHPLTRFREASASEVVHTIAEVVEVG